MKPLKLSLGGFTCFREPTDISFEDLELFAISGPTGAGKSTLLDAITYALYGRTARLGSTGLDALISPGIKNMFVTLEFRTDRDTTYRVTRVSERKGSRSPDNQTRIERLQPDATWRQLPESEKIKEANVKLSQIVGLDYEGFTRAVLLPQGAFDEFLRGNPSERRKLLVSLLNLGTVEQIGRLAGERARAAQSEAAGIRTRLEQDYAGATPARRRELEDELGELKRRKTEHEGERDGLAQTLKELEAVAALLHEQAGVARQLAALQAQEGEVAEARTTLVRAQEAARVTPHLTVLDDRQRKLNAARLEQEAVHKASHAAQEAARVAEAHFAEAEGDAARIPGLGERLEALAELRPLVRLLRSRGGDLLLAEGAASTGDGYDEGAWDALQALMASLPTLKRARREVGETQRALESAKATLQKGEADAAALRSRVESIKERGRAARERSTAAEAAYAEAEVENRAAALRAHLHLGKPCPVCAQQVKTLPPETRTDLPRLERERDAAKAALEGLLDEHRDSSSKLDTLKARLEDWRGEVAKAEAALGRSQRGLAEAGAGFARFRTDEPEALEKLLEGQRKGLLTSLAQTIRERAHGLDPERAHAQLTAERKGLQEAFETARTKREGARRALETHQTKLELLSARLSERVEETHSAAQTFEEALERTGFHDAAEVRAAALPEARLGVLETRIKTFQAQRDAAERKAVELQAALAGRTLDEGTLADARAKHKELETLLGAVQRRLGGAAEELEGLERLLARAKSLRERESALHSEHALYRQLSLDLRSDKFPDFLMTRVQATLAARASQIIREVTEGRYDLLFTEGDYHVLDTWNTGELRSAKTLSGGESFVTSLALALALSDILAGSKALGALFLDEGFGTLDAETLSSVTEVLQALTAQGRMVGVITHVTALSESLPNRLMVQKGPRGSSVSWDG